MSLHSLFGHGTVTLSIIACGRWRWATTASVQLKEGRQVVLPPGCAPPCLGARLAVLLSLHALYCVQALYGSTS